MEKKKFIHDLQNQEFYDSYNNFMLTADTKVFNKLASKFFFLSLAYNIPGDIVELGVFKGSGLAGWLKVGNSMRTNRKVIGFDFFNQNDLLDSIKTIDNQLMESLFIDRNFDPTGYKETLNNMLTDMNFHNFELHEGDFF